MKALNRVLGLKFEAEDLRLPIEIEVSVGEGKTSSGVLFFGSWSLACVDGLFFWRGELYVDPMIDFDNFQTLSNYESYHVFQG